MPIPKWEEQVYAICFSPGRGRLCSLGSIIVLFLLRSGHHIAGLAPGCVVSVIKDTIRGSSQIWGM